MNIPRPYVYLLLFFLVSFVLFKYVLGFVLPFLAALIIALLIDPLVGMLQKKVRLPRGVAAGITLLFVFGIVVLAVVFGAAKIVVELGKLSKALPSLYVLVRSMAESMLMWVHNVAENFPPEVEEAVIRQVQGVYEALGMLVNSLLETLQILAFGRLPTFITNLLVTMVASFFLSRDKEAIGKFVLNLFPSTWREGIVLARTEVLTATVGLINAQIVLVLLTTAVTIFGLSLLRTGYALSIGLLAGILDIIPIIGPSLIFVPWITFNLLFGDVFRGILLATVYVSITGIRSLVQAHVIGERIGIHPLATLIALYLGVKLFGVNGLIIGPVMAIVLKAAIKAGLLPAIPE